MKHIESGFYAEDISGGGSTTDDFESGEIIEWRVGVGDTIQKGDTLFEAYVIKAAAEFSAHFSGKIVSILFPSDSKWEFDGEKDTPYGKLLLPALFVAEVACGEAGDVSGANEKPDKINDGELSGDEAEKVTSDKHTAPITPVARRIIEYNDLDEQAIQEANPGIARITREHVERFMESSSESEAPGESVDAVISATPAARALAQTMSIEVEKIHGTGDGGTITREDVEKASSDVFFLAPSVEWRAVAHSLERGGGIIAGGELELDLSPLLKFKQDFSDIFRLAFGVRFRVWAPIALAIAQVLTRKEFMTFNGYWHIEDENHRNKDKVALYRAVHLGLSYDTGVKPIIDYEKGTIGGQRLRIATLHDTARYKMEDFFRALDALMQNADYDTRHGKIEKTTLRDWSGHSFIFNNIGVIGHSRGNSILTPKMSAMLNMGRMEKDGKTVFQIFFDHRMMDGRITSDFLNAVHQEMLLIIKKMRLACFARLPKSD